MHIRTAIGRRTIAPHLVCAAIFAYLAREGKSNLPVWPHDISYHGFRHSLWKATGGIGENSGKLPLRVSKRFSGVVAIVTHIVTAVQ